MGAVIFIILFISLIFSILFGFFGRFLGFRGLFLFTIIYYSIAFYCLYDAGYDIFFKKAQFSYEQPLWTFIIKDPITHEVFFKKDFNLIIKTFMIWKILYLYRNIFCIHLLLLVIVYKINRITWKIAGKNAGKILTYYVFVPLYEVGLYLPIYKIFDITSTLTEEQKFLPNIIFGFYVFCVFLGIAGFLRRWAKDDE